MDAREMIDRLAVEWGCTSMTDETINNILRLAGEVAHASERKAAPLACFLAGQTGVSLEVALQSIERMSSTR